MKITLCQNYTEVLQSAGIMIRNTSTDSWGSGVSVYDINQDGWDDVTFAVESDTQYVFLSNNGVLEPAPFKFYIPGEAKMALWLDYDNDSDLDFFATEKFGRVFLWQNDGNFNFTDVTATAGLSTFPSTNFGASFGDYDRDGDLDLYLCRYQGQGSASDLNKTNNLFRNNGDGTFTNVTLSAGVHDGIRPSFLSVWYDYDRDGWSDLFVINDRVPVNSSLYKNNQDGTFTDVAGIAGTLLTDDNPMAGSFGDFDNDKDLDLFVGNTSSNSSLTDMPPLFVNNNNGTFTDQAAAYNIELRETTWGGLWLDYDNDTDLDLYVATDYLNNSLAPVRNYFLVNNYPNPFQDDSTIFSSSDVASSHAVARGDFNRDGFYDIAVHTDSPTASSLWVNSGNANNYIRITAHGVSSNTMAIGSWIHVYVGGEVLTQYIHCGENYLGQNSQHQIFGMGSHTLVDSVHVVYPSGITDRYYDLAVNQSYDFTEGESISLMGIEVVGSLTLCTGDSVLLRSPNLMNYQWSTGASSQSIYVHDAGVYSLTGQDSLGQYWQSSPVTVEVLPAVNISTFVTNQSCNELEDGAIELNVENGGYNYSVDWSNGISGDTLLGLMAGSYAYEYIDENQCHYRDSVFISAPYALNTQVDVLPETHEELGSVAVLVNGGTPPYVIEFNGDSIDNGIDGLTTGEYVLSILDANDCVLQDTIMIPFEEISDTVINTVLTQGESVFDVRIVPSKRKVYIDFKNSIQDDLSVQWFALNGQALDYTVLSSATSQLAYELDFPQYKAEGVYYLRLSIGDAVHAFLVPIHRD